MLRFGAREMGRGAGRCCQNEADGVEDSELVLVAQRQQGRPDWVNRSSWLDHECVVGAVDAFWEPGYRLRREASWSKGLSGLKAYLAS